MMRKSEHSNVPQIKYFKVLVQEMAVKVDQGFINAMISLFVNKEITHPYGVLITSFRSS
jgi:vacuolar protein sorting-associated protein 13A/C